MDKVTDMKDFLFVVRWNLVWIIGMIDEQLALTKGGKDVAKGKKRVGGKCRKNKAFTRAMQKDDYSY